MGEHILTILADFFQQYGYWTILGGLLLENAGVPVPGETSLLYGSFLASSKHTLSLPYIVMVAIIAAVSGDNIGYGIGRFGGRPLLDRYKRLFRISDETIRKGESLIARHGAKTIFTARFIAGLRVIAGPLQVINAGRSRDLEAMLHAREKLVAEFPRDSFQRGLLAGNLSSLGHPDQAREVGCRSLAPRTTRISRRP